MYIGLYIEPHSEKINPYGDSSKQAHEFEKMRPVSKCFESLSMYYTCSRRIKLIKKKKKKKIKTGKLIDAVSIQIGG